MPESSTPVIPRLAVVAFIVLAAAVAAVWLNAPATPNSPIADDSVPLERRAGEQNPAPRIPRHRQVSDFTTPSNTLRCPGDAELSVRNVLTLALAPTSTDASLATLLTHLRAEVIDTQTASSRSVAILLPGAPDCSDRAQAVAWLMTQPTVVRVTAIEVLPRP